MRNKTPSEKASHHNGNVLWIPVSKRLNASAKMWILLRVTSKNGEKTQPHKRNETGQLCVAFRYLSFRLLICSDHSLGQLYSSTEKFTQSWGWPPALGPPSLSMRVRVRAHFLPQCGLIAGASSLSGTRPLTLQSIDVMTLTEVGTRLSSQICLKIIFKWLYKH